MISMVKIIKMYFIKSFKLDNEFKIKLEKCLNLDIIDIRIYFEFNIIFKLWNQV